MTDLLPASSTFLVGGAVRDKLLGRTVKERDWCVIGLTPTDLIKAGFTQVGKDFPVFLHPETHEEYALARTERKKGTGHHGFECFFSPEVTLEEDLKRRDLTINAMAEDQRKVLIDPYHGQQDLKNRILRHVSSAFIEDPLRVLRVARFQAQLSDWAFTIAPETFQLMQTLSHSGELEKLSKERIWAETLKALNSPKPDVYFTSLRDVGALHILYQDGEMIDLDLLDYVTQKTSDPMMRICCAAYQTDRFLSDCKAPKVFIELGRLCYRFFTKAVAATTPENYLDVLISVDAIRRPERFDTWLTCCEFIANYQQIVFSATQWKKLQRTITTIDISSVTHSAAKGANIAKAVYQIRLDAISKCF